MAKVAPVALRQRPHRHLAVPLSTSARRLRLPLSVQDRQVVGTGEALLLSLQRGQLGTVALQDIGQHADGFTSGAPRRRQRLARTLGGEPLEPRQLGAGLAPGLG
jgi:hypothetical protein